MKFSQYTLNQVGGTNGQVLAQGLVYNQRDFWNFVWANQINGDNGWDQNTFPIDLTGATISAEIIRRQVTAQKDTRCGMDLTIEDYPTPRAITVVTSSDSATKYFTANDTSRMFVDQPVDFTGTVFGSIAINTNYYVAEVPTATTFSISTSSGGPVMAITTASGSMIVNRAKPNIINLPITNINATAGAFTVTIDDDTWNIIAGDPELDINSTYPICFTGRVKISFPANGDQPAYDQIVFLLFTINSDGVIN